MVFDYQDSINRKLNTQWQTKLMMECSSHPMPDKLKTSRFPPQSWMWEQSYPSQRGQRPGGQTSPAPKTVHPLITKEVDEVPRKKPVCWHSPWTVGWHPGCGSPPLGVGCAVPPAGPGRDPRSNASAQWTAAQFLGLQKHTPAKENPSNSIKLCNNLEYKPQA